MYQNEQFAISVVLANNQCKVSYLYKLILSSDSITLRRNKGKTCCFDHCYWTLATMNETVSSPNLQKDCS